MTIRTATMNDLNAITAVEVECFPAAEAASREEFSKRLTYYNDHFWLMFDEDKLIAFVDGFVTDELLHYYAKFGFVNEGLSESDHGGAEWYQMRITF